GEPHGNFGLFEIDEASLPSAVGRLQPRVVVVTNLFRDQMDRYFELDTLAKRIGDALAGLPATTTLVLNADDPLVANLAALAAARALDLGLAEAIRALANFRPAFGRLETIAHKGRTLRLVLVKNPAGFNAAIGALLETGRTPRLLAALSDRDADGRDVSWIWDADFEALAPSVEHAVITGIRGRDLALRFKYAGLAKERLEVVDDWS